MKTLFYLVFIASVFISCNTNSTKIKNDEKKNDVSSNPVTKDTTTYPYKALYSSDLSMSTHPENAQKVLTIWKMFEHNRVDDMKPYFADTVTYENASGHGYHGSVAGLLAVAKREMDKLDSLRFDITTWESIHSNDKNEDWVNVWCYERRYPKMGAADTTLMYERWMLKDGRINYFNQYIAKVPKH